MDIIDGAMAQFLSIPNFAGAWINSTNYTVGQILLDPTDSSMRQCLVSHTSAAYPTTFAQDRANNPTYWTNATNVPADYAAQAKASADAADISEANAASSASNASTSASQSATSAANSKLWYDNFRGIYYGAYASPPTLDPNGNAITLGDLYFNTSMNKMQEQTSAGWQDLTYNYINSYLPLAGGTMTGAIFLAADPTATLQASTKGYVDNKVTGYLALTGGTMFGPLTLAADPTADSQAATRRYVDSKFTGAMASVASFNTRIGAVVLNSTDVTTALTYTPAPTNSPSFTGNPTAPTPTMGDNDTSIATTAFVQAALGGVPGGAIVSDTVPTADPGALWWDSVAGELYVRYNDGNSTQWVTASNAGLGSIAVSDTPPASPAQNTLWFCSTDLMLYIRYYDGNSTQWVPAVNLPASVGEAPIDTATYGRSSQTWTPVVPMTAGNVGRNLLHNSMFNIAQRGLGPWTTNNVYTADRWLMSFVGGSLQVTIYGQPGGGGIPGDEQSTNEFGLNVTGTAGAGDFAQFMQRIEGVSRLSGRAVIVSFYANASAALKVGVNLTQVFGSGGSPSASVAVTGQSVTLLAGGVFARYSLTFNIPSIVGKTLGTTAGTDFTQIAFWVSSGANNNTTSGGVGVQSGSFNFWGIQAEIAQPGQTQPTALEKLDPVTQLQQCQRFYQVGQLVGNGYSVASVTVSASSLLPVLMRATPTVALGSNFSTGVNTPTLGTVVGGVFANALTTATAGYSVNCTFTASADL